MIVDRFNFNSGISIFHESSISTDFHAHPAMEFIISRDHSFNLYSDHLSVSNVTSCILSPNSKHKLIAPNSALTIYMIEPTLVDVSNILERLDLNLIDLQTIDSDVSIRLEHLLNQSLPKPLFDERITKVIDHILNSDREDSLTRAYLSKLVFLSESRLSHLFKKQVGCSLQSYLKWHKMKLALNHMIDNGFQLTNAALEAGFYDLAEFSNQFKKMFGLSPSHIYNSSTIVQGD